MDRLTGEGRINLHRTQTPSERYDYKTTSALSQMSNGPRPVSLNRPGSWRLSRSSPYDRGRVGKITANPHRHRTLVLNNKVGAQGQTTMTAEYDSVQPSVQSTYSDRGGGNDSSQKTRGWVTKRDRHMQLINSSIYDKETQLRSRAIEETRKQKALRRDQHEKHKIEKHLQSLAPHSGKNITIHAVHEISINGLKFHVLDGGSKLARIRGEAVKH